MTDLIKFLNTIGPILIPFLAGVGIIALILRWRKVLSFFTNEQVNGNGDIRRRDDNLVQQLIKQNADMMGAMMKVVSDNTDALRGVKDSLDTNGTKLDGIPGAINNGLRDIHARLDNILSRGIG